VVLLERRVDRPCTASVVFDHQGEYTLLGEQADMLGSIRSPCSYFRLPAQLPDVAVQFVTPARRIAPRGQEPADVASVRFAL